MDNSRGESRGGGEVEAAALPAPSPPGLAHRGAGIWGSSAGTGRNSVNRERGGFVPAEAAVEDPPQWSGAHTQGLGEQEPKPHTPPTLEGRG